MRFLLFWDHIFSECLPVDEKFLIISTSELNFFCISMNITSFHYIYIVYAYLFMLFSGMFLLPIFFSKERVIRFIQRINFFETSRRDYLLTPCIRPLIYAGVHPNVITLIGFGLAILLWFGFWQQFSPLALLFIALGAGLSDMFDGVLARSANQTTSFGGMLDGLRDLLLFFVLTVGNIHAGFMPTEETLWFVIGAVFIGLLKFWEVLQQSGALGFNNAFRQRFGGDGKLSIDRIKFFFFVVACLGFFLEQATERGVFGFAYLALILSVASSAVSVLFHSFIIGIRHRNKIKPSVY